MKHVRTQQRRHSAFTLIELLVVIAIIAILATIAVPTGSKVMENARKLQAKTAMKGLEIAIKGYQTEYNRLPLASTAGGELQKYVTDSTGAALLDTLMAKDTSTNPRQIKFYEPPTGKNNANGYIKDVGLLDPWGQPYHIEIDYSGTGLIENPYAGETGEPDEISTSVIIYSYGTDKTFKTRDDVKSWN